MVRTVKRQERVLDKTVTCRMGIQVGVDPGSLQGVLSSTWLAY